MKQSPLRRRGKRKAREQAAGLVDGPLCDYVRRMECSVPGCVEPGEPHHVKHGGLRRDYLPDGTGNVAPLCHLHHRFLHDVAGSVERFEEFHAVWLPGVARQIGERFHRSSLLAPDANDDAS